MLHALRFQGFPEFVDTDGNDLVEVAHEGGHPGNFRFGISRRFCPVFPP